MIGQVLALDVSPGQETFLVGSQWDKHWREEIIMAVSESPNRTQGYTKSNSATFLLRQFVANCDMLHAIFFFIFEIIYTIFPKCHLCNKFSISDEHARKARQCEF